MKDRVTQLKQEIEDLRKRMPAHSVKPVMLQQLEALEEELEELLEREAGKDDR